MTTAKLLENESSETYIKWLELATMYHDRGLHEHMSVLELANAFYKIRTRNENKDN